MSLRPPVTVCPPDQVGDVHFIAVGGTGMSGIAQLYAEQGIRVSGSDRADSPVLQRLRTAGVTTFVGHDPSQLGQARTVVVSSAIPETNPELAAARRRGLRVWHRSAALAALMLGRVGISIAGTHGKTTTSAMAVMMLEAAGADPSYVIGSPLQTSGTSAHLGQGDIFVVEADESDGTFLQYPTRIGVVTTLEADHLDNWGSAQRYAQGFVDFATASGVEVVIIDADDPGCRLLVAEVRRRHRRVVTVGEASDAEIRLVDLQYPVGGAQARLLWAGQEAPLVLSVPGVFNLHNAAAAFAVGLELGLDPDALLRGAAQFRGTERRFQLVAEVGGITIVDDYAHHPTEIAATLTAAREMGVRRVVACFQPHLYSRTRDFAVDFGQALAGADLVMVTDVYPAREEPIPGISGALVAQAAVAAGATVSYVERLEQVPAALARLLAPGDLVLTLGAGDITTVGPRLASLLERPDAG